jgi:hypothetical protein
MKRQKLEINSLKLRNEETMKIRTQKKEKHKHGNPL